MKYTIIILVSFLFISGCDNQQHKQTVKDTQSDRAAKAASQIKFTENAEIENIKKRLQLTSNPGLLGYVVLMNEAGQPVLYSSVKGKITSGGKRLTRGQRLEKCDRGRWNGECIMKAPSDEGTWGSSSPYVFFWDMNGRYHQWNGKYLYSDQPIRLRVKPLVINIKGK